MLPKVNPLSLNRASRSRCLYRPVRWFSNSPASSSQVDDQSTPALVGHTLPATPIAEDSKATTSVSPTGTTDTATGYAWLRKAVHDARKPEATLDTVPASSAVQPSKSLSFPLYPPPRQIASNGPAFKEELTIDRPAKGVKRAPVTSSKSSSVKDQKGDAHDSLQEAAERRARRRRRRSAEDVKRDGNEADGQRTGDVKTSRKDKQEHKSSRPARVEGEIDSNREVEVRPLPVLRRVVTKTSRMVQSAVLHEPGSKSQMKAGFQAKKKKSGIARDGDGEGIAQPQKPPRVVPFDCGRIEITQGGITFRDFLARPPGERQPISTIPEVSTPSSTPSSTSLATTSSSADNEIIRNIHVTNRWLRDNCRCPQCIQPSTGQKLRRSGDFAEAQSITPTDSSRVTMSTEAASAQGLRRKTVRVGTASEVELGNGVVEGGDSGKGKGPEGLIIEWDQSELRQMRMTVDQETSDVALGLEAIPLPSHRTFIPTTFLKKYLRSRGIHVRTQPISNRLWTAKVLQKAPTLHIQYEDFIRSDQSLHAALTQLAVYGLVILKGVPTERTSNEECELRTAMNRIGEIRNTFYGETWDVQARKDSKNVAYTNVDLGLHQDLLYFESPPRFQALHCLRNKVEGGSSYFVDSFKAAEILFKNSPLHYIRLATNEIPFHYDNDGYYYYNRHKTIEANDPAYSELGKTGPSIGWYSPEGKRKRRNPRLHAINYSPPFQAPWQVDMLNDEHLATSMQMLEQILDSDALRYEFTMEEGDLALFDNRRVLHARREFRDKPENTSGLAEGEPTRWLKGCYLDGDVIWNKQRVLSRKVLEGELQPLDAWKPQLRKRLLMPDDHDDVKQSFGEEGPERPGLTVAA